MVLSGAFTDAMHYDWNEYFTKEQMMELKESGYITVKREEGVRKIIIFSCQEQSLVLSLNFFGNFFFIIKERHHQNLLHGVGRMVKKRIGCLHAHYSNIEYIEEAFSAYEVEFIHFVDPGLVSYIGKELYLIKV
jgi:hypothetical protein